MDTIDYQNMVTSSHLYNLYSGQEGSSSYLVVDKE